jgi:hypothetical protein
LAKAVSDRRSFANFAKKLRRPMSEGGIFLKSDCKDNTLCKITKALAQKSTNLRDGKFRAGELREYF